MSRQGTSMRAYSNIRESPSNVTNPGVDEISHTAIYKVQRSIYRYEILIQVYTSMNLVYHSMAELSRVIGFQMDGTYNIAVTMAQYYV